MNKNSFTNDKVCYRPSNICVPDIFSVSEATLLAAIVYGEASNLNSYEEMASIASAIIRKRNALHAATVQELVKRSPGYSKVIHNGSKNFHDLICANKKSLFPLPYKAASNALLNGNDFSNGACFWDGLDLKTQGKMHYRYKEGFRFTKVDHNIFNISQPPPIERSGGQEKYYYTYESTAVYGNTVFWKYTDEFLKSKGAVQCV